VPAATNRADLIAVTEKEYARLATLIGGIPADMALRKAEDDTSIKDIVAHRANWIGLFFGWVAAGRAGDPVHLPVEGYKWSELPAYSRALRAAQRDLGWDAARAGLADAHDRLMRFLEETPEAELYTPGCYAWTGKWTLGRYAEAAGASHYRSAARVIRGWMRAGAA
jgi:hypothetical protein